jgi:DNA repair protein RadA/Sms
MAKKIKIVYICSQCQYQSGSWLGKCPECGSWGTLEEQSIERTAANPSLPKALTADLIKLSSPDLPEDKRIATGIDELDIALGGGITNGSVIMIGGEPGVGKSTLMLQLLHSLKTNALKIYICGEESPAQIKQRAKRINVDNSDIELLNSVNLETIITTLEEKKPTIAIVDSIQTLSSEAVEGVAGNSGQMRYCAEKLIQYAKQNSVVLILIGHITKDGFIAGPKTLEHVVDTVLYFEGENLSDYRLLRSVKNRFGAVNELALFRMGKQGLSPVKNPSEIFLTHYDERKIGSAVLALLQGNRPFLVEVQALVTKTQFGTPQRVAMGVDHKKMNLLLAILEKRYKKPFGFYDVFIKTAAAINIDEPASDLAICMALVSSLENAPLANRTLYLGEVGLNGEARGVKGLEKRIWEAEKLGFETVYFPKADIRKNKFQLKMVEITSLDDVLEK